MKVLVEFTKNFAGKKKGDTAEYDGILASALININKVAKRRQRKTSKEKE